MDRSPTHTMTPSHQQLQRCTIQLRPRSRNFPNEPLHSFLVVRWRVPNLQILPLSLSHSSFIACTCPYDWQVWIFRCLENVTNAIEFVFNPPTVLSSRHPPQKCSQQSDYYHNRILCSSQLVHRPPMEGIATETIRNEEILVPGIVHCFKVSLTCQWLAEPQQAAVSVVPQIESILIWN